MFPTLAGGLPVDFQRPHLPEIRPDRRVPGSILSRYSAVTTCFGGFGLTHGLDGHVKLLEQMKEKAADGSNSSDDGDLHSIEGEGSYGI